MTRPPDAALNRYELWMCVQRPSHGVFTWMVWDRDAMEPTWFKDEDEACGFLADKQKGRDRRVAA